MALSKQKLVDGLKDAFTKAKEVEEKTKKDSEGNDVKVSEAINSQSDIAGFIADAIVSYAADAEVLVSTPFTTPVPAPDPSVVGAKLKVQTSQVGKEALKSAVLASMNTQDAAMLAVTNGIIAYTLASFTVFANSAGTITASGASAMVVPPALISTLAVGLAGGSEDDVINLMSTIIHASFVSTTFTGVGVNATAASTGPVVSTLV